MVMRTLFQRGPKHYSRETKLLPLPSNIGRMDANAFFVPEAYNIGNTLRIDRQSGIATRVKACGKLH
jgi:hypothetical protein